uniref:ABC transmembrane type-1 domain-containing protein n=1 Tax=Mycena chlorophos TaxID=658473 RepID=A0ABQ0KXV8_MYCCL|nr:predicted protein [Mycena chlorophos]
MAALCAHIVSATDLSDACVRSSWAATIPFGAALVCSLLALPLPIPAVVKQPFAKFLTLHEAEAAADHVDSDEIDVQPVPRWRARVFAFVGVVQSLTWAALAVASVTQNSSDKFTVIQLGLVAATWLYTVVRSVALPPQTAPFDLFVVYALQLIGVGVVLGGYAFEHAHGDAPLPSKFAFGAVVCYAAVIAAMLVLAINIPMNLPSTRVKKEDIGKTVTPEDYATIYQWMTFSWVYPLIKKGTHNTLNDEDVWRMSPTLQSLPVFVKFQALYRSTLLRSLVFANFHDLVFDFLGTLGSIFLSYAGPYLLKQLLDVLAKPDATPRDRGLAHLYAALMFVCALVKAELDLQHLWYGRQNTARVRSQVMAAIYDKALKRKDFSGVVKEKEKEKVPAAGGDKKADDKPAEEAKSSADVGKIVNLMSGDAEELSFTASSIYILYGAPFELLIGSIFLYQLLGWSAFTGFFALFAVMPINRWITQQNVKIYERKKKAEDKRMALLDELIAAVKFVKFFAWEERWMNHVMESRDQEIVFMTRQRFYTTMFNGVWNFGPLANSLVSFATYVWLGNELTVAKAFTALAIFSSIRSPLNAVPMYIVHLLRVGVGLRRIEGFLAEDEVDAQGNLPRY